jgi:hypothetical protein
MHKSKITFVCLVGVLLVVTACIVLRIKNKENYHQKTLLAQEIHKVLDHLMFDLYDVSTGSLQDLPADGKWYDSIAFKHTGQGVSQYALRGGHLWLFKDGKALLIADYIRRLGVRRQKETPDILELQIEAQNGVSLLSNLKIRLRH